MSDNKNLKPGWKVWRFDQMATNVNVRIDNPSESGMEYYVGLEHLDSDSLKIRRWGTPDDVEATKLMFKKGDIIFGRRRAYQRKLGVADFDGICSAHAMVLRAKPEVVLPEFLPFFMQSDLFMSRAVEISVGSLSPTINWKTMAAQEFALPPLQEQQAALEVLRSIEDGLDASNRLVLAAATVKAAFTEEYCWQMQHEALPVGLISSVDGRFLDGDWIESKDMAGDGIRLIQLADIGVGRFLDKSERYVSENTFQELKCTEVHAGDILISRMADPIGRACIIPQMSGRFITAVDVSIARVDPAKANASYWCALMNTQAWRRKVDALAAGTTRTRVSRKNLEAIQVPMPPIEYQNEIAAHIDRLECAIADSEARLRALSELKQISLRKGATSVVH